jgi:hypothetical protein
MADRKELADLLSRAAAALEGKTRLTAQERQWLVEGLRAAERNLRHSVQFGPGATFRITPEAVAVAGGPIEAVEPHRFLMRYRHCGQTWAQSWSSIVNDKCPVCNAEIEPYDTEDL